MKAIITAKNADFNAAGVFFMFHVKQSRVFFLCFT